MFLPKRARKRPQSSSQKLRRPFTVEFLEDRVTPAAVFTWTGTSGDNNWFTAGNWTISGSETGGGVAGVPDVGDSATFNNGAAGFATLASAVTLGTLTVSAGVVNLSANITAGTADFSAGGGTVNTGASALVVTGQMLLSGSATASLTGGTSFAVSGSNIVGDSQTGAGARTFTVSGGTLHLSRSALITGVTATSSDNNYANASNTVAWDSNMSTPSPDKAALQSGNYPQMWTPLNALNSYILFDLGATYELSEIYLWQYNQFGLGNRSIQTANLFTATSPSGPAKLGGTGWTSYNPGNFPWPQATGAAGDHTVVDMPNINRTARYVEIDPTSDWGGNDVHGGLSKALFYALSPVTFPNTNIVTTGSAALDLHSATGASTLGSVSVAAGATLTVQNGASLTVANVAATGASGTATLTGTTLKPLGNLTAPAGTTLVTPVVTVNDAGTRTQTITGDVSIPTLSVSNPNVTLNGYIGVGSQSVAGSSATVSAGTVNLGTAAARVFSASFSGAGIVNTGSNSLVISSQALLTGTTVTLTGGTSFAVSGANITNDSQTGAGARQITVSGGTLTFAATTGQLISGVTATSNDNNYANASNTVVWDSLMSTPTPDKAATQGGDYTKMWTPLNGFNAWIQFDLGAVYTLQEIFLWQYNQFGLGNRSIQTANIFYATNPTGHAKTGGTGWTAYNPGNFPWPQATGAAGDHTVVDINNLGLTARYIEINPLTDWGANDVHGGLSKVLFYQPAQVSLPNTSVIATGSGAVSFGTSAAHTLGSLSVAGGSVLSIQNAVTLSVTNVSATGSSGVATVSGTTLKPTGDMTAPAGTSLRLPTVAITDTAPRTQTIGGDVGITTLSVSNPNVTLNGYIGVGSGSVAGSSVTVSAGTVSLGAAAAQVFSANFSGGIVSTGANSLIISSQAQLSGTTATLTGGTSFAVRGANIVNDSQTGVGARTITVPGGTLSLASTVGGLLINGVTATASDNNYANASNTVIWDSLMSTPTPDKAATQGGDYTKMWTPANALNAWIQFDLGAVYTLQEIFLWQYNQFGLGNRSIQTANIFYATNPTGHAKTGGTGWTQYNPGNFPWPQATGAAGDHSVVDMNNLGLTARYIEINPTADWGANDVHGGLSKVLFYQPAPVSLPNTSVIATASATVSFGTATDHTLGSLSVAAGSNATLSIQNANTLSVANISATGSSGSATVTGTTLKPTGDMIAPAGASLFLGTVAITDTATRTQNISGDVGIGTLTVSNPNVTLNGYIGVGSGSVAGSSATVSAGTVNLGAAAARVFSASFSGAAIVNTGGNSLAISSQALLSGITATLTGGTSFAVSGANIVNDSQTGAGARTMTVSGGTLTFASTVGGLLINGVTATSNDNNYANASNTVVWDSLMSTPTPDKAATQGGDYTKMWTPLNGFNAWIQFDLGAVYTLQEIFLWQYNQFGLGNRSIQTANIFYATNPTGHAKTGGAGWTQYNPGNFPWPQATGAAGDHTVVDMNNLGLTARYIEINPTADWGANDVHGGLSKVLFYQPAPITLPNTSIAATASSTVSFGTSTDHTLGSLSVATGSTLSIQNANTLNFANASATGSSGVATVNGTTLKPTGNLSAPAGTSLRLGTVVINDAAARTQNISGDVGITTLSVSNPNVTLNGYIGVGSGIVAGSSATVSAGTVNLGAAMARVFSANFSGAAIVNTGSNALAISSQALLSGITATLTGGTSFSVSGANIVNDSQTGAGARTMTVSGGTLTFASTVGGLLINGVTATSNDNNYANASNTVVWDSLMSTPTPDKAATQGGDYTKMWTPLNGFNAWIQFDLGAVYTLQEIFLWQYNQFGLGNRSIQTANIFYATNPTGHAKTGGTGWTQYNPGNFPWPQATGAAGDHSVVDMNNLGLTARYIEINPTADWGANDVHGGLSKVLFYQPAPITLPNTSIAATASSTVSFGTSTDHTLGSLSAATGSTLSIQNATTLTVANISATGSAGSATVNGTVFKPTGDMTAAPGTSLTISNVTINDTAARTQNIVGDAGITTLNVSNPNLTLNGYIGVGSGTVAGSSFTMSAGTVNVGPNARVAIADVHMGAGTVNTGANALSITDQWKLPGGINATLTGGTSFAVRGANIINDAQTGAGARNVIVSSGTLAFNQAGVGSRLLPAGFTGPGPVAWYNFDNASNFGADSSGNGYDLTVFNNPAANPTGRFNGAIALDNSASQSMTLAGADWTALQNQLAAGTGQTEIIWLKKSAAQVAQQNTSGLQRGMGAGSNDHYTWDNGFTYAMAFGGDRVDVIPSPSAATQQTWVMMAIVRDPSNPTSGRQIFFNPASGAATPAKTQAPGTLAFGPAWDIGINGNNNYFGGSMDDIMVFNAALSVADLARLFNDTATYVTGAISFPNTRITATASATLDLGTAAASHTFSSLNIVGNGTNLSFANATNLSFSAVNATGAPGDVSSIAAGTPVLQLGGPIDVAAGVTLTVNATIGGSSAVTKTGPGTLSLAGAQTYTGPTTVSGGTLLVNTTLPNNPSNPDVIVNNTGTLGGAGTILGTTHVNLGGAINPGNSPGTLTSGTTDFVAGASFNVEIVGNAADLLIVNGDVTLAGSRLIIDPLATPIAGHAPYRIITNNGTNPVSGIFTKPDGVTPLPEGAKVGTFGGVNLYVSYVGGDGNDVELATVLTVNGTAGNDTLVVRQVDAGHAEFSLNGGPFTPMDSIDTLTFNGQAGTDQLLLDLAPASPFNGNLIANAESIRVTGGIGNAGTASFRPNDVNKIHAGSGFINYSGTPSVDFVNLADAGVVAPSGAFTLQNGTTTDIAGTLPAGYSTPSQPALTVTGASGVAVRLAGNTLARVDTGFGAGDTITVAALGATADGPLELTGVTLGGSGVLAGTSLDASALDGISLNTSVASLTALTFGPAGNIVIVETDAIDLASVQAIGGSISVSAGGDINVSYVAAFDSSVTLQATGTNGSILDLNDDAGPDVESDFGITLVAKGTGTIGVSANALDLGSFGAAVDALSAQTDNRDLYLAVPLGDVRILKLNAVAGGGLVPAVTSGNVFLTTDGNVFMDSAAFGGGADIVGNLVSLTATGDLGTNANPLELNAITLATSTVNVGPLDGAQFLAEADNVAIGNSGLNPGSSSANLERLGGGTAIYTFSSGDSINDVARLNLADGVQVVLDDDETLGALGDYPGHVATAGFADILFAGRKLTVGANGNDTSYSGILSGANGQLVKTGVGRFTEIDAGLNTYSGLTTVENGALVLAKTGGGNKAIAGAIMLGDSVGATGSAVLEIAANEQIADAAGIQFTGIDGRLLSTAGTTETITTPTDFAGGDVKIAGLVITTNAYDQPTGTTTLNGGVLRVGAAGTLNSSLGTSATPGGTLQGSGTIYTNILTSWGTIDPSSGVTDLDVGNRSPGRITIRGNLQMTASSTTNLDVAPTGSDQLNVGINTALALPAGSYTNLSNYDLDPYLRGDVAAVTEQSRRGVNDLYSINGAVRFHGTLNTRPIQGSTLSSNVTYGNAMNFVWRALNLPMGGFWGDLNPKGGNLSSVPSDFTTRNSLDVSGLPAAAMRFDPRFMGSAGQFNAVGQAVNFVVKFMGNDQAALAAPAYSVGQAKGLTLTSLNSSATVDTTAVKVTKQLWNAFKDSHTRVTLTITNTSAAAATGPLYVELVGIPAGATVFNAAGKRPSTGKPYLVVPAASLAAGAAVTLEVDLLTPIMLGKTAALTTQVLRGGMP